MSWSINLLFLSFRKCISVLIVLSLSHKSQRCGSCDQTHFCQHSWALAPQQPVLLRLWDHTCSNTQDWIHSWGNAALGDFRDCVCELIYDPQVCCVVALFFPQTRKCSFKHICLIYKQFKLYTQVIFFSFPKLII